jgi:hypothetical protein
MNVQLDRAGAFGDGPRMDALYEHASDATTTEVRLHADAVNDRIPARDQDRYRGGVSYDAVNEPDSAPVHFRDEQANIFIRDQALVVGLFPDGARWLTEEVRKMITMQRIDFVEQRAQGFIVISRGFTNDGSYSLTAPARRRAAASCGACRLRSSAR